MTSRTALSGAWEINEGFLRPNPHDGGERPFLPMKPARFVQTSLLAFAFVLHSTPLAFRAHAASGDLDLSFDAGFGINGPVTAVVVQPDGKVMIGGQFTMVKGLMRANVARLNADGSGDSSFNSLNTIGSILTLALQPDGKVLVGYGSGISRLNSDGSHDTSFSASVGV